MSGGAPNGRGIWAAHLALLAGLFALQYILPPYHATNLARVMVLALFATGYNLAFGYTGLLSLGHALFFAAGMFAGALPAWHFGLGAGAALLLSALAGAAMAGLTGLLALRTAGVSFMIVTLMFAKAFYLTLIYFNQWTGGDQGFALPAASRVLAGQALSQDGPRFFLAWALFSAGLLLCLALVRSRFGRVMVAMRENEDRSRLLGYNPYRVKLLVLVISGGYAGLAGGTWAVLFGYAGAGFAEIQYSILPLLYVLMGGAGVVAGPLLGAVAMFWLVELAAELTSAWLFLVGAALVVLVLFAPRGVLGWVRARLWRDLP